MKAVSWPKLRNIFVDLSHGVNSFEECYRLERELFGNTLVLNKTRVDLLRFSEFVETSEVSRRMLKIWLEKNELKTLEEKERQLFDAFESSHPGMLSAAKEFAEKISSMPCPGIQTGGLLLSSGGPKCALAKPKLL